MADRSRRDDCLDLLWLVALGLLSSAAIVAGASYLSGTFDERFYLESGLIRWHTGSTYELMKAGTMPLPIDVQTFALRIVEWWRGQPWRIDTEYGEMLPIARAGTLIFWWLALFYAMRIGRDLGGPWAGRLAIAGLAVEPNLLAHAGLATTDIAIAATTLMFAFHYRAGRLAAWRPRVLVPAVCCAAAIVSKASGLAFVPLCMIAIETERLWAAKGRLAMRDFAIESATIGAIAMGLIVLYCGTDFQPHSGLIARAHDMADGPVKPVATWLAENFRVFNNAGVGLFMQFLHNLLGHGTYLLGFVTNDFYWYYFPVALSIKLPLALLTAPLLLAVFAPRRLANFACLAALSMLAFSLSYRVQNGVRMQLPLIALAIVGLSAAGTNAMRDATSAARRTGVVVALLAILATGVSTAQTWPYTLSYVNEAWGPPAERLLSDSNADWGQGLLELEDWRRAHGAGELDIWYFGTDPRVGQPPFHHLPLHALQPNDAAALAGAMHGHYLAVGTTVLYGPYVQQPAWLLALLRVTPPFGRTSSFLIFDRQSLGAS